MAQATALTGRYVNATCYLTTGIFLLILQATKGGGQAAVTVLIGLGAVAYGLYIAFSRGSYWVSTWTYVIPIVLIALAFA